MSYCPRCGIAGGGSDKNGRPLPNHVCLVNLFADGFPSLGLPTDEQIAAKKRRDEECRGRAVRIVAELAAIEKEQFDKRAAHDRKMLEVVYENRKRNEERKRAADVTTNNLNFDVKE